MGLGVKGPMAEGRSHICGPLPFAASQPPRNPGGDVKFQASSTNYSPPTSIKALRHIFHHRKDTRFTPIHSGGS